MPYWQGDRHFRVGSKAHDQQTPPSQPGVPYQFDPAPANPASAGNGTSAQGGNGIPVQDGSDASAQDGVISPEGMGTLTGPTPDSFASAMNIFPDDRIRLPAPAPGSPGAATDLSPDVQGIRIRDRAKGSVIGLLPQGSELRVAGNASSGWAQIAGLIKGTPVAAEVGGQVNPHAASGWVYLNELDAVIDPKPLDAVVVLPTPYPVKAGDVVGYVGEYQRYRESQQLPPKPEHRPLLHVEVFTGADVKGFIERSQARVTSLEQAKKLPASDRTLLQVNVGTQFVVKPAVADNPAIQSGLVLKVAQDDPGKGFCWAKVQPTRLAATQGSAHGHHGHAPAGTPVGNPVWVERDDVDRVVGSVRMDVWSHFPLQVSAVQGPKTGFEQVFVRAVLETFSERYRAVDDKRVHWWQVSAGDGEGNLINGWVCEQDHPGAQWQSPWAWPGFEQVDHGGFTPRDMYVRYLFQSRQLLDDEKDGFSPTDARVNAGDLVGRLEEVMSRLGKTPGRVMPADLKAALGMQWLAQGLSHLVTRYPSEWSDDMGEWKNLLAYMHKSGPLWQAELERIEKLRWWGKVKAGGVPTFPDPVVWHFHPIGLVGNFAAKGGCLCSGRDITSEELKRIDPAASDAHIQEYIASLNSSFSEFKVNSCIVRAYFLAQILLESGHLTATREINPHVLPYDPWRGRGLVQLTGKANYDAYQNYIHEDVTSSVAAMEKLERTPDSVRSAFWYFFIQAKLMRICSADDFIEATVAINGGYNGYDDRLKLLNRAIKVLGLQGCTKLNRDGVYHFEESRV